jgi:hypothetical protein
MQFLRTSRFRTHSKHSVFRFHTMMHFKLFLLLLCWLVSSQKCSDMKEIVFQLESIVEMEFSVPQSSISHVGQQYWLVCETKLLVLKHPRSYHQATKECIKRGGDLMHVQPGNIVCLTWYLGRIGLAPAWIGSWPGSVKQQNKSLAVFGRSEKNVGAIAVPFAENLPALCQRQ